MPFVSVVIPAYNSASTIRETLASVHAQTYTDYEVIVVDDASSDATSDIVRDESQLLPDIRCVTLPENSGPAFARNCGVAKATGEWIAFLDADDAWLSNRLGIETALAEKETSTALWCGNTVSFDVDVEGYVDLDKDGCKEPSTRVIELAEFAEHNPVATSTVLVRKQAIESVGGFDESFRGPEDYDLWMRIAAKYPVAMIDAPLSKYRSRSGSLSMDERMFLAEVQRLLDKAFGESGALAGLRHLESAARSVQLVSASWMAYNRNTRSTAVYHLVRSWIRHPGRLPRERREPHWRLHLLHRYLFGRRGC